ncbi:hypothetical protein DYB28_004968 [Aphanomyces astaci]|uniref:Crinkler effector protein N-terminal domain-containing protein n=1 Tax=Aphanomyces astaci TaxID=112090 RepID=A0A9X8DYI9_APHAT|nr:hypothetical protein DYB28_004968 [Aphanomyces astaci]
MLKLVCHIVGGREPFAVKIDANELVTDLKTQIKEQNPSLRSCNAMDIQLYQSLKDATWLSAEALDQMTSDGVMDAYLATIREMKPTDNLAYYFGPNPPPLTKHVKPKQSRAVQLLQFHARSFNNSLSICEKQRVVKRKQRKRLERLFVVKWKQRVVKRKQRKRLERRFVVKRKQRKRLKSLFVVKR